MKQTVVLLCSLLLLISCKSKSPESSVITVKPDEVEAIKKDRAYELGKRLLEACNTSRFKAFSANEATDKVRQNATRDKISSVCKKINQRNGRFLGLTLLEVTHNKATDDYIFRYAIAYEKKLFKRELFVTVNHENKVSAIATKEVPTKPL
ncbi:hypothetical protein [Flavobacterium sp. XGLA_31]|uniref:hypothetical protein n=1 Tax=Flavobacterium sp. XGLA_31 TaxID=3447666 RepID=UPI003F31BE9D